MAIHRRDFLRLTAYTAGSFVVLGATSVSGAEVPMRPPGARSESVFLGLCLRCGQCSEACKEGVLHPGNLAQAGLVGLQTPIFTTGCTLCMDCTRVCPTGAIEAIDKSQAKMGRVVVDAELCVGCWKCLRDCQQEALIRNNETRIVEVDLERCVGCGLCIPICPTKPKALALSPEGARRP